MANESAKTRYFLPVALSAVVSLGLMVLAVPTRTEVTRLIQTESPYVQDRKYLVERLDSTDRRLERIESLLLDLVKNRK